MAAVGLGLRRRARADDDAVGVDPAGDERLRTVEHVVRAVVGQHGRGPHAREVGAGAGLGHRDGPHLLAGDEGRQPALLLLLGAQAQDVGQAQGGVDAGPAEAHRGAGDLLGHDGGVLERADAGAAVLLGHLDAEDPELAELRVQLARHEACGVPLVVVRHDLLLDEVAQGEAERLVVLVERRAPHRLPPGRVLLTGNNASTRRPPLRQGYAGCSDVAGVRPGRCASRRGSRRGR